MYRKQFLFFHLFTARLSLLNTTGAGVSETQKPKSLPKQPSKTNITQNQNKIRSCSQNKTKQMSFQCKCARKNISSVILSCRLSSVPTSISSCFSANQVLCSATDIASRTFIQLPTGSVHCFMVTLAYNENASLCQSVPSCAIAPSASVTMMTDRSRASLLHTRGDFSHDIFSLEHLDVHWFSLELFRCLL